MTPRIDPSGNGSPLVASEESSTSGAISLDHGARVRLSEHVLERGA